ncbi:uncharacterized protein LOC575672 [Strongylocentrotus purpuratus]|uniref:Uncharacterized protein n=1 Tax=Strongylocentrotus purpuratus TaxID=7668 RepID=A0A7M7GI86_STRPU|nr:uncharacterized protein LOC575672 [Strongylocentrotus purpuratus]XP_011673302.1 uncharacterized protein LOC575672 [Strongylocentrotus purpuratus]XP_801796.1 uncharacterized protein LOC575672 [Strongylocentrotus purpuratus]|eukprot:XP_003725799.1 PREDICTED: uncharacterized protein LOC575672 [Strongylocentrotus purpuratus]
MAHDGRDVTATSKPRGSYLDPLKACSLSGENGVPVGKSESATFSKYNSLIKQSRRNATRASVLNDVERSRFDSIVKRMESEHVYHTAVLDRQKRQFRKSLQVLEKDRRAVKRYFDKGGKWVATPLKLVDGVDSKMNRLERHERHDLLPPIEAVAAVQEVNTEIPGHPGDQPTVNNVTTEVVQPASDKEEVAPKMDSPVSQKPPFPTRRLQSMPMEAASSSIPKPPQRFHTGDDLETMREHLMSGHHDKDDDNRQNNDVSASI